ncbi:MAG TPA: fused MFS/spermidine synthase [Candidatus Stackebrandtia excrementipullorum]|nr:fused MFS/spermidine synthase [Candidatus Stackebrandtia excrementipullorum]
MIDQYDRMDLQATVDAGQAELVADPGHPQGWTLLVNDVAQSYVDLADPTRLPMMYARLLAAVADVAAPPRKPVTTLHLGAGGLTLPRYVAATRPGSRQTVVEIDRGLVEFVSYGLPLPATANISIRIDDAADAIREIPEHPYELIYSDIYRGGSTPAPVTGVEFAEHAAAALAPGGLFVVNVLDATGLLSTRRQVATLRRVFDEVVVFAGPSMLRGRRDGNVIVLASSRTLPMRRLHAAAERHEAPLRSLSGEALDLFVGATAPVTP